MQAKGKSDNLASVQARQDIAFCAEKFPTLICRSIAAQLTDDETIVLFELTIDGDEIRIVEERHYRLVPGGEISEEDLRKYGMR